MFHADFGKSLLGKRYLEKRYLEVSANSRVMELDLVVPSWSETIPVWVSLESVAAFGPVVEA